MQREMNRFRKQVEEAVAFLAGAVDQRPGLILELGTGLGGLAEQIEAATVIPYAEIPHFPRATVASHAGNLIFGRLAGWPVAALQGRFHFYEGYSTRELTMPVRVLSLLGAHSLIVANAAGGLDPEFVPGTLMAIRDHLNFLPDNPLRGPNIDQWGVRFPDLSRAYDPAYLERFLACADRLALPAVTSGVYVAIPGPSLETPAETRYLRRCGADAVGMSTVPEVIVARHAGLRVLGVSVVSNVNDPDNFQPIVLEEIIEETSRCGERLQQLLIAFLEELAAAKEEER